MFAAVGHREPRGAEERPPVFLIAGGHTGGHIQCALAIAAALERARPGARCVLGGARGGPEIAAAKSAGYPIETVWIGALDRRRNVEGLAKNLLLVGQLGVSLVQARLVLGRVRPDLVVGVGGFPSAPFVLEAQRRGIPTVLHEANALPGVANRFLARRASAICLGDPAAQVSFPGAIVTGNPARPDLDPMPAADARELLGFHPTRPTILVTGGSLGSTVLNEWVATTELPEVQIIWQCGRAHEAALAARRPPARPLGYIEDMAVAYSAADVVVAPAGAMTVAELGQLGKAAILVPTPDVTEDHQTKNAEALRQKGVPVCVAADVPTRLAGLVTELLGDPAKREAAARALAQATGDGGAADRIAACALQLVERA